MWMVFILALAVIGAVWWLKGRQTLNTNERLYLRRRGYDAGDEGRTGPAVSRDTRVLDLIESLGDVTPYSRERAAEELSVLCETGEKDERMFAPLVTALDDNNAAVRGAVALALGNLGDPRAIEPLRRVAGADESAHARALARRALEKLQVAYRVGGDSAQPEL
jgi:HEAT repeat protein